MISHVTWKPWCTEIIRLMSHQIDNYNIISAILHSLLNQAVFISIELEVRKEHYDTYRVVHLDPSPCHSSAISLALAPVMFPRCNDSDRSPADARSSSSTNLTVIKLISLESEVPRRNFLEGMALAFPLALLEMAIVVGDQYRFEQERLGIRDEESETALISKTRSS